MFCAVIELLSLFIPDPDRLVDLSRSPETGEKIASPCDGAATLDRPTLTLMSDANGIVCGEGPGLVVATSRDSAGRLTGTMALCWLFYS